MSKYVGNVPATTFLADIMFTMSATCWPTCCQQSATCRRVGIFNPFSDISNGDIPSIANNITIQNGRVSIEHLPLQDAGESKAGQYSMGEGMPGLGQL
jgi:hypothetical protein